MSTMTAEQVETRPRSVTPLPIHGEAELICMLCGRTVATIVNRRALQHAGCTGRLRIERGVIRCCHCNGPVYREALNA